MGLSVLVDFDGTIALEDTTDLMLERFANPLWRSVETEWVAGRIGSRERSEERRVGKECRL